MKYFIALALCFCFVSTWAMDLDSARSKGLVKELPTGYIEAVDPSAKSLATEINGKRKAAYEAIAQKSGVDAAIVGQQAAQKIQEKLGK